MKLKQIPRNTVVHTPTEEEAKELLNNNGYDGCKEEKPQPKFKLGDKVKVVGYQKRCITTMRPHVGKVGTITATNEDRNYYKITCDNGCYSWHEDWLEPYTEPETKDGTSASKK